MLDNNPPPVSRAASCHGPAGPNRRIAALVARPTASTASATTDPAGPGGSDAGANTNTHRTKNPAISVADLVNRRSQPRTVAAGNPRRAAIGRCPTPPACSTTAEPITSTLSRRRSKQPSGNNTCVAMHNRQRDRRGRRRDWPPSRPRMTRQLAYAHGPNTPPHDGQPRRPPTRSASTTSRSPPTMSTDASGITSRRAPSSNCHEQRGGPYASKNIPTLTHHHHPINPTAARYIVTLDDANPPPHHQTSCRSTPAWPQRWR